MDSARFLCVFKCNESGYLDIAATCKTNSTCNYAYFLSIRFRDYSSHYFNRFVINNFLGQLGVFH